MVGGHQTTLFQAWGKDTASNKNNSSDSSSSTSSTSRGGQTSSRGQSRVTTSPPPVSYRVTFNKGTRGRGKGRGRGGFRGTTKRGRGGKNPGGYNVPDETQFDDDDDDICNEVLSNYELQKKENLVELTLSQCFKKNTGRIHYNRPKPPPPSRNKSEIVVIDNDDDCVILDNFNPIDHNKPFWSANDYQSYCDVLNIQNFTKDTITDCVRIPKSTGTFNWSTEFNNVSPDKYVLKGLELDCVTETIDAALMIGDFSTECGCGLPYNLSNMDFFDDDDETFDFNLINSGSDTVDQKGEVIIEQSPSKIKKVVPDLGIQAGNSTMIVNSCNDDLDRSPIIMRRKDLHTQEKSPIVVDLLSPEVSPQVSPIAIRRSCRNLLNEINDSEKWHNLNFVPSDDEINLERSPIALEKTHNEDLDKSPILVRRNQDADKSREVLHTIISRIDSSPEKSPIVVNRNKHQPGTPIEDLFGPASFSSTPLQNKDKNIHATSLGRASQEDSSDSDDDFLPASPERKSNPIVIEKPKTDAAKKFVFKHNPSASRPNPLLTLPRRNSPDISANFNASRPNKFEFQNSQPKRSIDTKVISEAHKNLVLRYTQNKNLESPASSNEILLPSPEPLKKKFIFKKNIVRKITFAEEDEILECCQNPQTLDLNSAVIETPEKGRFPELHFPAFTSSSSDSGEEDAVVLKPLHKNNNFQSTLAQSDHGRKRRSMQSDSGWINLGPALTLSPKKTILSNAPVPNNPSTSAMSNSTDTRHGTGTKRKDHGEEFELKRKRKKSKNKNPYIIDEASVSGSESSSENEDASDSDLDVFDDSFVDEDADTTITESQQVRYMKSMKDLPPNNGRGGRPLQVINTAVLNDLSHTEYEADSFCVTGDEVEYAEVGNYTQAMINAREDLEREEEEEHNRRLRAQLDSQYSESPKPKKRRAINLRSKGISPLAVKNTKPKRKRVIEFSSEDESD